MQRKVFILTTILALLLAPMWIPGASSAEFPSKPLTVVIPFGAGGSHDLHARGITSIMTDIIGQPMIVKLLPGGAGMKATGFVAKAKPDGYTILFTHNGIDMIVPQTRKVPFNTLKAFKTVAKINHSNNILIANPKTGFKSWKDFYDYAKKNPGKLNVGHSGVWGSSYVTWMELAKATGIKANLIPHKGGGPSLRATIAGRDQLTFAQAVQGRPQVVAGKVVPLAIMGDERLSDDPVFKDVPSMKELGYPGVGFRMDRIFMVPSGISAERYKYLEDAFAKLNKNKSFRRFMGSIGMPINYMKGEDYDKTRPKKYEQYTDLIKSISMKK